MAPGSATQVFLNLPVCLVYLGMLIYFRPYVADADDTFAVLMQGQLALCLFVTLMLKLEVVKVQLSLLKTKAKKYSPRKNSKRKLHLGFTQKRK